MTLSKKSWHYWIYSKYFNATPRNLCPYFWKVVLCALFIVPLSLLYIPLWIIFSLCNYDDGDPAFSAEGIGMIMVFYLGVGIFISMVAMWFTKNEGLELLGILGYLLMGIFILGFIFTKASKTNHASLISSYFEAKKNKYCPKIEWENNERV